MRFFKKMFNSMNYYENRGNVIIYNIKCYLKSFI